MKNPFCNPKPLHRCYRCGELLTHDNVVLLTFPGLDDISWPYFFDENFNLIERKMNVSTFLDEERIIEDYNEIEEICETYTELSIQCSCGMQYKKAVDKDKFNDSHEFYSHITSLLNEFSTPSTQEE